MVKANDLHLNTAVNQLRSNWYTVGDGGSKKWEMWCRRYVLNVHRGEGQAEFFGFIFFGWMDGGLTACSLVMGVVT